MLSVENYTIYNKDESLKKFDGYEVRQGIKGEGGGVRAVRAVFVVSGAGGEGSSIVCPAWAKAVLAVSRCSVLMSK